MGIVSDSEVFLPFLGCSWTAQDCSGSPLLPPPPLPAVRLPSGSVLTTAILLLLYMFPFSSSIFSAILSHGLSRIHFALFEPYLPKRGDIEYFRGEKRKWTRDRWPCTRNYLWGKGLPGRLGGRANIGRTASGQMTRQGRLARGS